MSHGRPHPPDEFDVDVVPDGPHGVHRAPRSALRRWAPFLVVLVVFPALAFVGVTWLSSWEGRGDLDLPVFGGGPTESETQQPAETTAPTTTPETTPTPTPTPTPTRQLPDPDLNRPVVVYNATQIGGLAGGAAEVLRGAGFTQTTTNNWGDALPSTSIVYYPLEEDEGTAQAAADALGLDAIELSPERAGDRLVVVLTEDYAP